MAIQLLGVYTTALGGGNEMDLATALLISVVGFAIVFVVLGVLAFFVKGMGGIFDKLNAKKAAKNPEVQKAPAVQKSVSVPVDYSAGQTKLTNVSEQEAAVIMALVSHNTSIPLNKLQFNSIKLMEDKKK